MTNNTDNNKLNRPVTRHDLMVTVVASVVAFVLLFGGAVWVLAGFSSHFTDELRRSNLEACFIDNQTRGDYNGLAQNVREILMEAADNNRKVAAESSDPAERKIRINTAKRYEEIVGEVTSSALTECEVLYAD